MNDKILKTLEFDKIKEELAQMAVNEKAIERIKNLVPAKRYQEALLQLERCDAALVLLLKFSAPRISKIGDIENSLKRINAGGENSRKFEKILCRQRRLLKRRF